VREGKGDSGGSVDYPHLVKLLRRKRWDGGGIDGERERRAGGERLY